MQYKTGDMCKFRGSAGARSDLLQLSEYDRHNKVWYATNLVYGQMVITEQDIEKLPKDFSIKEV